MTASGVTQTLVARLHQADGREIPVKTQFTYQPSDPWAVTFAFWTGPGGWVEWTMGRQLLADGLTAAVGEGDVRIKPLIAEYRTRMSVASDSGSAVFSFDSDELQELLALTEDLVPWGGEHDHVDLDAEIRDLLAPAGGEV